MMDVAGLPSKTTGDVQIFNTPSLGADDWKIWNRPKWASMLYILCVGGGAGGGGGFSGAAGAGQRGGGGSGGLSGMSRLTIPAFLLPERLYLWVGAGGQGNNSAGGAAGSGVLSYVSVYPAIAALNTVLLSGAAAPTGGVASAGTAGGAAGGGGTIAVIGSCPLAGLGFFEFVVGRVGNSGGGGGAGGATQLADSIVIWVAGSGSGVVATDVAGAGCSNQIGTHMLSFQPAGAAAGSNNGSAGPTEWGGLTLWGGMGGASSNAGIGGDGGRGAPGAGGGGGGGGTTGGRGGNGGDGIIVIVST